MFSPPLSTRPAFALPHINRPPRSPIMKKYVTHVTIEMHSSFAKQGTPNESRDTFSSLWTLLPSRDDFALGQH